MDIYLDGGKIYMTALSIEFVQDRTLPFLSLEANCDYTVTNLELTSKDSIW